MIVFFFAKSVSFLFCSVSLYYFGKKRYLIKVNRILLLQTDEWVIVPLNLF